MNLTDNLLGEGWYWAAWSIWGGVFLRAILKAPWRRLQDSAQLNVWLGMVVLLTLVWSLTAGVKPGLSLHLLGATVFSLCFGGHLAFIGLSAVVAGIVLNGASDPFAFALNALILAGLGVAFSMGQFRLVSRYLPRHFFVYVFVNGFLGAALTLIGIGCAICGLLAFEGAYPVDYLFGEYFPYFMLLGFSEAWLSGMLMTLFVVYRPEWVSTFDDFLYLSDK